MAYPSTLSSFTDPSPTDRLSTTPHSSIETAQNTGLRELQAFIGTLSSTQGTLMYDIRAAASNGGGHVQTVNKGGTGQTTYSKGDLLIASSSSVLTKLATSGNDNDFLAVNSSVATGINWVPGVTSGQIQNQAFNFATETGTGSVYSISPVPCVLSYASGQEFSFIAKNANTVATPAINVSSLAARSIKNPDGTALNVGQIAASMITVLRYNGNSSVFQLVSTQKAPTNTKAINVNGVQATFTGTPTQQLVQSFSVPAGTMGANDAIRVQALITAGNALNSNGLNIRWNATNYIIHDSTAGASNIYVDFTITNRNSTTSQVIVGRTQSLSANGTASTSYSTSGLFTTATEDTSNALTVGLSFNSSNNSTYTVESFSVELLKT